MDSGCLWKRVRKMVGDRRGYKCRSEVSGAAKNEEKLLGGCTVNFVRERRGDGAGTSLAQAPRGGALIEEKTI